MTRFFTKGVGGGEFSRVEWTDADNAAYRAEVERRFAASTPVRDGDMYRIDWRDRVARSEMRGWSEENLNKLAPESEEEWVASNAVWYRAMARRVMKRLDPDAYAREFKKAGVNTPGEV